MKKIILLISLTMFYLTSNAQVYWGFSEPGVPIYYDKEHIIIDDNIERPLDNILDSIEKHYGKTPGIMNMFMFMMEKNKYIKVPVEACNKLVARNITPMITLEVCSYADEKMTGDLDTLTGPLHKEYWLDFANQLKKINGPVILRWGHEMNGNWYPWGANDTTKYINAWIRTYNVIMNEAKASNVIWYWCFNNYNVKSPDALSYYPGDAYVDWVGFDAYDKKDIFLEDIFKYAYNKILNSSKISKLKPIMIGEFATDSYKEDPNAHKLNFLNKGGEVLFRDFPKIKAFIYFNIRKNYPGGNREYRLHQSIECRESFKNNWISNVNVVNGNKGIANFHKIQTDTSAVLVK
jgi:hypothetical protein